MKITRGRTLNPFERGFFLRRIYQDSREKNYIYIGKFNSTSKKKEAQKNFRISKLFSIFFKFSFTIELLIIQSCLCLKFKFRFNWYDFTESFFFKKFSKNWRKFFIFMINYIREIFNACLFQCNYNITIFYYNKI